MLSICKLTDKKKVFGNKLVLNFCMYKYNTVTWKMYDIKFANVQ